MARKIHLGITSSALFITWEGLSDIRMFLSPVSAICTGNLLTCDRAMVHNESKRGICSGTHKIAKKQASLWRKKRETGERHEGVCVCACVPVRLCVLFAFRPSSLSSLLVMDMQWVRVSAQLHELTVPRKTATDMYTNTLSFLR